MKLNYYMPTHPLLPIESEFAIMTSAERSLLYSAIQQLANSSIIVEVGSALGGTACLMASANPTITVNCVERFLHGDIGGLWNTGRESMPVRLKQWVQSHHMKYSDNYLDLISSIDACLLVDPSGRLAFDAITKNYPNIKVHAGKSPGDFLNWTQPVDMYLEDATHINPVLNENIKFWSNHIKPGGFIVGHDYKNLSFPDVVSEFNKLIISGWGLIAKVDSLIILQKP